MRKTKKATRPTSKASSIEEQTAAVYKMTATDEPLVSFRTASVDDSLASARSTQVEEPVPSVDAAATLELQPREFYEISGRMGRAFVKAIMFVQRMLSQTFETGNFADFLPTMNTLIDFCRENNLIERKKGLFCVAHIV